mgnify:CR=1 FL=1
MYFRYTLLMPVKLRFDTIDDFEQKISTILNYKKKNKYFQNSTKLREIGQKRILELDHNIGAFLETLNTPFGSDERTYLKKWN